MPWCPNCKLEYREGYERCNDCDVELVKELKNEETPVAEYDKEAFLITVITDIEASIIESKLKLYDIPVLRKYKNAGGYLTIFMGATPFGIDLYVPSKSLGRAEEIIAVDTGELDFDGQDISEVSFDENQEESQENDMEKYSQKKRSIISWAMLIFITSCLIYLAYVLIRFFKRLL